MISTAILGAAIGHGARDRRTEHGPPYLLSWGLLDQLAQENIYVAKTHVVYPAYRAPRASAQEIVAEACCQLAAAVASALAESQFPIVLGGDHSCAIGTWSGVSLAYQRQPFGLIWIDAHCDSHTPDTTESGAIHGMPLAALLGYGDAQFTKIAHPAPKLLPAHTVLIGIRSYEAEEMKLLQNLGVKVYGMEEVRNRGFTVILNEAASNLLKKVNRFGLTLDLDALDPNDAPGVGSPEANGIAAIDVIEGFLSIKRHAQLIACEITEYNPFLDLEHRTAGWVRDALISLLGE